MDYIPFFLPFLLLSVPLSLPLPSLYIPPSLFLSPLLLLHHFTNPPALHPCPLSYVFQSFILVFPVPGEDSLHISSEHSHRLLSWWSSVPDIPDCTDQSLSAPHSYIVYSEILLSVDAKFEINFINAYNKSTYWCDMNFSELQNWSIYPFADIVQYRPIADISVSAYMFSDMCWKKN